MVPNLRFSNLDKLMKVRLGDICTITGGYAFDSHKMTQKGDYQIIKMGNLYNGIFDLSRNSSFINAPTKKELEYLIQENDILITLTGTTNKKDYGYTVQMEQPKNLLLNQRCALIRASKVNEKYLFYLLNSNDFLKQFYASSTGGTGNQTNVSINDMLDFKVYISNENDQSKISNILNALDKKILTQIKIIDRLYSQIKYIKGQILNMTTITETKPLGQLCNISTGKRDANEMKSNGSYKFFTCSKDDYCIDTYSFDGEALIISGNGELGLIKYYNGKFDAYQRTYVLQNFKCHPKYLMYVLQNKLPKKIEKEKNVGAMPYIVLKTLTSINIDILNMHDQIKIVNILNKFEEKLENDRILLELFEKEKSFLLKNLFV